MWPLLLGQGQTINLKYDLFNMLHIVLFAWYGVFVNIAEVLICKISFTALLFDWNVLFQL